ncbi:MAG TPA: FIST N-terminal domain-containing protein [Myxococcales bacterium]|jgi:hypothetical protein
MKCRSFRSVLTDAYRAGCEVGEGLSAALPEVVVLFASTNYLDDVASLLQGVEDGLGAPGAIVFGCSGDGVYESGAVGHFGVSALSLDSGGAVRWTVSTAPGVRADSFAAGRECARRAVDVLGPPDFAFALADGAVADGAVADGSRLVDGLSSVLQRPYFGGLAADDRKFARTFVLANGKAHQDTVALLAGRGAIRAWMSSASGWTLTGAPGTVDACRGNVIERIGGTTAGEFIRRQLGKTPDEVDLGVVPLATFPPGDRTHPALRTPLSFDSETGAVTVFGSIAQGSVVQACTATRGDVIAGVDLALGGLRPAELEPAGVLVVSCAGRKWLMGDQGRDEVARLQTWLGRDLPLAGFPSYGEIGPFRLADGSCGPSRFHNVTLVLCVLGK